MIKGELKYVIAKVCGVEMPLIFDRFLNHRDMARGLKPVSAGFCSIYEEAGEICVRAWGRSDSLDLESRSHDAEVIRQRLEHSTCETPSYPGL